MRKKIYFSGKYSDLDRRFISDKLSNICKIFFDPITHEQAQEVSMMIASNVDVEKLAAFTELSVIQNLGSGVEKLKVDEIKRLGIQIFNSYSHTPFVAEFAVALAHDLVKKITINHDMLRRGVWWRPKYDDSDYLYQATTLRNSSIGLIGFGRLGQYICNYLEPYNCKFLAYNRSQQQHVPHLPKVQYTQLAEVIERSDLIFVTLPITESTYGIVSAELMSKAKRSSLWVVISRGDVINQNALYEALLNDKIAGAAIDAWFQDGRKTDFAYPASYSFHTLQNVILSPYKAMYLNGVSPNLNDVIYNVAAFCENKILNNKVN